MRKLLIIGADYFEIEIVRAAKEMGYYTIVTDNRINWDNAPAKKKPMRHGISAILISSFSPKSVGRTESRAA